MATGATPTHSGYPATRRSQEGLKPTWLKPCTDLVGAHPVRDRRAMSLPLRLVAVLGAPHPAPSGRVRGEVRVLAESFPVRHLSKAPVRRIARFRGSALVRRAASTAVHRKPTPLTH